MENDVAWIELGEGADARRIAVRRRAGKSPGLVWLGGFMSDMRGTKAEALDAWAAEHGRALVRFDYSGHGESDGAFEDGTIGSWLAEAVAVFTSCCRGPQVVVGSSMGGWLALLLVRALARRQAAADAQVAGLVLIAPAADFTEALMWPRLPPEGQRAVLETGVWQAPTDYGEMPYTITRGLIEDGRANLILGDVVRTGCPVRILQGMADPDVPWQHTMRLVERLAQDDATLTLIKDGDHRLSRPGDLELIVRAVEGLSA